MKEKVFETIFRLISTGQITKEEAYYLFDLLFTRQDYYIPNTWTSTSPATVTPTWIYNPNKVTPAESKTTELNDWWHQKATNDVDNISVYTSCATSNIAANTVVPNVSTLTCSDIGAINTAAAATSSNIGENHIGYCQVDTDKDSDF